MDTKWVVLSLGMALLALPSLGAENAVLVDEMKKNAVMIAVQRAGDESKEELGSGILLCQNRGQIYVLTANHVFNGEANARKRLRLSQINGVEISFFGNTTKALSADQRAIRDDFKFYTFEGEDLLLFEVKLPWVLPVSSVLAPPPGEAEEQDVASIGTRAAGEGETWVHVRGELFGKRSINPKLLYYTGDVEGGFSGGPLFNRHGELIGINLQRTPGSEVPGGAPESSYGTAQVLSHQDVVQWLYKFIPGDCMRSSIDLTEAAHQLYRRAMREVTTDGWEEAVSMLRSAAQYEFREGGSVHLEGMRYTRYLPHYHLGLALYELDCINEALLEWEISEAQGEIQDDRRYRSLKRLRKRAQNDSRNAPCKIQSQQPAADSAE